MLYVPPEEKERIKREVSVLRLAEARGIKLHRSGRSLMGLCPFHDDRNPSLSIDPVQNVWNCKGACGEGGDVFLWVMRAEGVSFHHALELLRREYLPSAIETTGPAPKQSTVRKLPPLIDAAAEDKKLLEIVVSYYHRMLKESPEALRYLEKRGLRSAELVDRFRLGYANRTLSLHLPKSNRVDGETAPSWRRFTQPACAALRSCGSSSSTSNWTGACFWSARAREPRTVTCRSATAPPRGCANTSQKRGPSLPSSRTTLPCS